MQSVRPVGTVDVVVTEPDHRTRERVCAAVDAEPGLRVVAQLTTLTEVRLVLTQQCPQVVVIDGDGCLDQTLEFCSEVTTSRPGVAVVLYSARPERLSLGQLSRVGASGVLDKHRPLVDIGAGIIAAARGLFVTSSLQSSVDSGEIALPDTEAAERKLEESKLTDREHEVLMLMAEGLGNREIAAHLFISENTVKNHVRSILDKFNANSRMAAVVHAVRQRILNIT